MLGGVRRDTGACDPCDWRCWRDAWVISDHGHPYVDARTSVHEQQQAYVDAPVLPVRQVVPLVEELQALDDQALRAEVPRPGAARDRTDASGRLARAGPPGR